MIMQLFTSLPWWKNAHISSPVTILFSPLWSQCSYFSKELFSAVVSVLCLLTS
jgi:hypothetical protein